MSDAIVSRLEFDVRGFDCGYGGPLGALAIANFLQEAAGMNADTLGFGMEAMDAKGRTWMLSRLDLRVDELPRCGELVTVATWPAGVAKLFALRDFRILGADGRSLVRAVYAYLIVDLAARRPLRPQSVFGAEPPTTGEPHPVADFAFEIPPAVHMTPSFAQRVGARHIDHNGHANNAHIVNWLVDASIGEGERQLEPSAPSPQLSALRVEFLAEALAGDDLAASRGSPAVPLFRQEAAARQAVTELTRDGKAVARALVGRR
jgi:medium-chain acyl-[acyl-carrier-protein] hydrolase